MTKNVKTDLFSNGSFHLLWQLSQINTQSENILGVHSAQKLLAKKLCCLGFVIQWHKNLQDVSAPMLYAFKKGKGQKHLAMIGHVDSVLNSKIKQLQITSDERVIGQGLADAKSGLCMGIGALEQFLQINSDHLLNFHFFISPNEEKGSPGFQQMYKQMGPKFSWALGLEPALENGNFISSRNGNRWYLFQFNGRSTHAGRFDGEVLNAAHEAANFINKIDSFNSLDPYVRANVAYIHGGEGPYNVTCGQVYIKVDVRFPSFEWRDKLHQKIMDGLYQTADNSNQEKCWKIYCLEDDCPPAQLSKLNETHWNQLYSEFTYAHEAKAASSCHSGGAADINYFSHPHLFCLDGLGPVSGKLHSTEEYFHLNTFFSRQLALVDLLKRLELEQRSLQDEHSKLASGFSMAGSLA